MIVLVMGRRENCIEFQNSNERGSCVDGVNVRATFHVMFGCESCDFRV